MPAQMEMLYFMRIVIQASMEISIFQRQKFRLRLIKSIFVLLSADCKKTWIFLDSLLLYACLTTCIVNSRVFDAAHKRWRCLIVLKKWIRLFNYGCLEWVLFFIVVCYEWVRIINLGRCSSTLSKKALTFLLKKVSLCVEGGNILTFFMRLTEILCKFWRWGACLCFEDIFIR